MDLISKYSIIPDSPAPQKKDILMPTMNKIYINRTLFSFEKEQSIGVCFNMDEP